MSCRPGGAWQLLFTQPEVIAIRMRVRLMAKLNRIRTQAALTPAGWRVRWCCDGRAAAGRQLRRLAAVLATAIARQAKVSHLRRA